MIGAVEIGLVMALRVKVITLLLAILEGGLGKLLRVSLLRLKILVIVAKLMLLTETDRKSSGRINTIVS